MDYHDYYATLGIGRNATPAEVKRAYRKLARQHHPDLKPGDTAAERRFKEINEANEVLSDPQKRKRYDLLGANWDRIAEAGGAAGGDPFAAGGPFAGFGTGRGTSGTGPGGVRFEYRTTGDVGGFSDFFRTFFSGAGAGVAAAPDGGGGSRRGAGSAGPTFEEILAGLGLDATGSAAGTPSPSLVSSTPGLDARRQAGPAAGTRSAAAEAEVELTLQEAFRGTSRLVEVDGKRLEVQVPPGVESGSRIRFTGKGGAGRDLHLIARVLPHPGFARHGADLTTELPLTLREALLGAEVPVRTLKGRVLLTVPPGTQNGRTFRLAGQGMPRLKPRSGEKPFGDLLAKVRVVLPTHLDAAATSAAERFLDRIQQPDPRATHA